MRKINMFKWLHLALFSLLPLVCGVFLFSGETDKRIRTCLILSLKRSYLKEEPLIVPAVCTQLESVADYSSQVPESNPFIFDLQQKLFSEFLDFRAISRLSQVDSDFRDSLKRAANQRLVAFHPHFASEDSLVNNLLYSVLNEHFRFIENTNDPLIHDHLQLLCAKYFFDDLDFNAIPSNIYYYIICFMFEMIYETDMKTPDSKRDFLTQLVCSFRTSNYSLELSYSYVLANYFIDNRSNDPDHFIFFYSNPSIEDIKTRFQIQDLHIDRFLTSVLERRALPLFHSIVVLEALLPEFVQPAQILHIYNYFSRYSHYSAKFVEMIRSNEDAELQSQIANFWAQGKYHNIAFEVAKLTDDVIDSNSELVSKITPTNLLEFDDFKDMSIDDQMRCLDFISSFQMYSLSKIDACSKLMVSNQSHLDNYYIAGYGLVWKYLNYTYSLPLEVCIKEAKISICKYFVDKLLLSSKENASLMRLLLGLMQANDPFIFLFFPLSALKKSKCLIQDKFDLNTHYRLNDRTIIDSILRRCVNDETFGAFDFNSDDIMHCNCSFSFKEIINLIGNEVLKSIFSSHPEEFDDLSTILCRSSTKNPASLNIYMKIMIFLLPFLLIIIWVLGFEF